MTETEPLLLCGVIGHPIGHSLSPRFQNAAFAAHLPAGRYLAWDVLPENLAAFVESARTDPRHLLTSSLTPLSLFMGERDGDRGLKVLGFNATLPHKEALLKLMDRCDPLAAAIGAVNTVVVEPSRVEDSSEKRFNARFTQSDYRRPQLVGYNTDAPGLRQALRDGLDAAHVAPGTLKRVLLLGASGAARGAAYGLLADSKTLGIEHDDGLHIRELWIANRSHAKAEVLAEQLRGDPLTAREERHIRATIVGDDPALTGYDLIVNATSLGVRGEDVRDNAWLRAALEYAPPDVYAYDLVYRHEGLTPFLATVARVRPAACLCGGIGMLVWQGALAFQLWTGIQPPFSDMAAALKVDWA